MRLVLREARQHPLVPQAAAEHVNFLVSLFRSIMTIRAAIIGPTGYSGLYLLELLLRHPAARIAFLASRREQLPHIEQVFPQLLGRVPDEVALCRPIDPDAIAEAAEVVFLCLPHRAAMQHARPLLDRGLRVIDLSADYRLRDAALYEQTYTEAHSDAAGLAEAVYGLTEFHRDAISGAMLIANPGCYPTAAALAIVPLLDRKLAKPQGIIVNAASGVTGAGRKPTLNLHFGEQNESFQAYGAIGAHRHQPEIEQALADMVDRRASVLFVPHLLPVDRGILETIYLEPASSRVTEDDLFEALERCYSDEPFVRVRTDLPNVKHVRDSNYCDLTVRLAGGRIVVFSALDNMIKGASGQAVQNMNVMFGQDETSGLM